MPAQTVIKVRRDTAANWISVDPTLASGEIGFETDTNLLKIGNGTDEWTVLPYASGAGGASVEISETAPAEPEEGDVWFNSTDGRAYIYYDSTWVDLNPGIAGPTGATGETGVAIQTSEPSSTDVLWLDTDEEPDVPVPAGGTDGQVLTKTSSADYATAWEDIPEGTAVVSSTTEPEDTGAIWYNTENGNAYIYYDGFWTSISGVPSIPTGGTTGQVLAKASNTDYATQWVAPSGLEFIKAQTIGTAVSSVEVTDAFSSTYDSYRIVLSGGSASVGQDIGMKLGSTTTGYGYALNYQVYGTSEEAILRNANAASWPYIFSSPGANGFTGTVDVQNPNLAKYTYMSHVRGTHTTSAFGGGYLNNTTQYTGFTLTPSSGTMSGGTIAVYGYKKA